MRRFASRLVPARLAILGALFIAGAVASLGTVMAGDEEEEPPPSRPTHLYVNLVRNPGAERGDASDDGALVDIPGWTRVGKFTAVLYGSADFPPESEADRFQGGDQFFAGGTGDKARLIQVIEISDQKDLIDKEKLVVVARAQQGGFESQADSGQVVVQFLDRKERIIGSLKLPTITGTNEVFLSTQRRAAVPARTRFLRVILIAVRAEGDFLDAYFDNIDVRIGREGFDFGLRER